MNSDPIKSASQCFIWAAIAVGIILTLMQYAKSRKIPQQRVNDNVTIVEPEIGSYDPNIDGYE